MVSRGGNIAAVMIGCSLSLLPCAALASVRIVEIMYNAPGSDEGREYVVVRNDGLSAVSLETFRFSSRSDRKDHRLREGVGSAVVQPGDTAVIASRPELFLQNYAHKGSVIDSGNFSLLNRGATISVLQGAAVVHTVSYTKQDGGSGDGNALYVQRDGALVAKPSSLLPLPTEEEKKDAVAAVVFSAREERAKPLPQKKKRAVQVTLLIWFSVVLGVSSLLASPFFLSKRKKDA